MKEIDKTNACGEAMVATGSEAIITADDLITLTDEILLDAHADHAAENSISMPIAQLATLGAGVASLIPALRTVTQTSTISAQGLYEVANAGVGDVLKAAKNGNEWGVLKTAAGKSKLAQFKSAGPLTATNITVTPPNPATMMMAVALFSIEQKLVSIEETGKQILSFLETEKKAEVEADVETLSSMLSKYKYNWDNERFVASNHKLVLDIQRTARKHIHAYRQAVSDALNSKHLIVAQSKVNSTLKSLLKQFKYYRLSLYTFSFASLVEILLSGNFKEENIHGAQTEIESLSMAYREIYSQCSMYLEKTSDSALETNFLKGVGTASKAAGKFIGSIPVIKEGSVDEFLQDSGAQLRKNAAGIEENVVRSFAEISNPGTGVFTEKMQDLIQIYNHTARICFDEKRIYLVAE